MRFGLAIGTERAKTLEVLTSSTLDLNSITHSSLQSAIQDELIKRGYSAEPGPFLTAFESRKPLIGHHRPSHGRIHHYYDYQQQDSRQVSILLVYSSFLMNHFQTRYPQS
jgi:hypothetical protein